MDSLEETLPFTVGVSPSLHWFSLLLPLEQVLLEPAVETTPTSVAMIAQVPLANLTLELVPH